MINQVGRSLITVMQHGPRTETQSVAFAVVEHYVRMTLPQGICRILNVPGMFAPVLTCESVVNNGFMYSPCGQCSHGLFSENVVNLTSAV